MAQTAAHLVDHVIPAVPIRQWVLSMPVQLRYVLAYDSKLTTVILAIYLRAVRGFQRRRARELHGLGEVHCGAFTVVQRFGGALNLNVHFHSAVPDGVWVHGADGAVAFVALPAPTDLEVLSLVATIRKRILRALIRRGLIDEDGYLPDDAFAMDNPLLAECAGASVRGRVATGDRAGQRVLRIAEEPESPVADGPEGPIRGPRCAAIDGFSLHANVAVHGNDRKRREHVLRYFLRPPVAETRLSFTKDEQAIVLELKNKWRDGTSRIVFTPFELIEKLIALIPAPRANLVRYHGVFAPNSKLRAKIIPRSPEQLDLSELLNPGEASAPGVPNAEVRSDAARSTQLEPPRNYAWADLLRRVFEFDVLVCPECGGRTRVIAAITEHRVVIKILTHLGLPTVPPRVYPARDPPDDQLEFALWPEDDWAA
jgi:hypothetical protein